jgi:histidyl-tRNA synthetase
MGEDRLVLTLLESQQAKPALAEAYIAPLGEAQNAAALELARELRRTSPDRPGLKIELGDGSFRLKKSFEAADKVARAIVLLGEDEASSGILTVKVFATGVQSKVARTDLTAFLMAAAS